MKKILTPLLTIVFSVALLFNLGGCGQEDTPQQNVSLNSQNVYGLILSVPNDCGEFFANENNVMIATNQDSTASIAVSDYINANGASTEDITKEAYMATLSSLNDLKILEFKNDVKISFATAVYTHYIAKKADGLEIEGHSYMIFYPVEDGSRSFQTLAFTYTRDGNNSLKQNIEAIKSSIKFN